MKPIIQQRAYLSKETAYKNTKKDIIRQCNWMMETETEEDVWKYLIKTMEYISTMFHKQELPIKKKTKTRHG
jgi:hypothetical protein